MIDFDDIETVVNVANDIVTGADYDLRTKVAAVMDARSSIDNAVGKLSGTPAERTTDGNKLERLRRQVNELAAETLAMIWEQTKNGRILL